MHKGVNGWGGVRVRTVVIGILVAVPLVLAADFWRVPDQFTFDGDGPINKDIRGGALKGYDVVAYHTEDEAVKGSMFITERYEDATFRFSTFEHRRLFRENPEAYLPAYGGFCAVGVANGYKDDMHPEAFSVIDGRLYFNLSKRIHERWRQQADEAISRADANWPGLMHAPGYGPRDRR